MPPQRVWLFVLFWSVTKTGIDFAHFELVSERIGYGFRGNYGSVPKILHAGLTVQWTGTLVSFYSLQPPETKLHFICFRFQSSGSPGICMHFARKRGYNLHQDGKINSKMFARRKVKQSLLTLATLFTIQCMYMDKTVHETVTQSFACCSKHILYPITAAFSHHSLLRKTFCQ